MKQTPLYEVHQRLGAKSVDFAGWEMPVQYAGVIEEHRSVRGAAGLFDVSHMGEIRVAGADAEQFLQSLTPNDVSKLKPGRIHYSGLLTEQGTYIDDLLVYRLAEEEFLLVVNASNADRDFAWIQERAVGDLSVEDVSDQYALMALQGPRAEEILQRLTASELGPIRYYRFTMGAVADRHALISRTGYTGEDGFELYVAPADAEPIWERLFEVGSEVGLAPAGLGARDTLRLEAAMALYGHEIDEERTPFDAGLDWVVKLDQGDFLGRDALVRQREEGATRRLIGFEMEGRGIARQGHEVIVDGERVGKVTSGTWSPTFEKALGMAYIPPAASVVGSALEIDIRGRATPARVVELPFYRRDS